MGRSKGHLKLEDADEALFLPMYISPVGYPLAVKLLVEKTVDVKGLKTHRFKLMKFEKTLQTVDTLDENPLN